MALMRGRGRGSEVFSGRVAAITGAGSGIGRALAIDLARRGAALGLADLDGEGVKETAQLCLREGCAPRFDVVDVTDSESLVAWAAEVDCQFGRVNLIFNNAGTMHVGNVQDSTVAEMQRVMDVNFWGVVFGTKAFLPSLIASGAGHVVNVSSAFGFLSAPSYGAYNASKAAVRGFTDALRQEMVAAGHPVQVTCVYPGGVRTPIMRNCTSSAATDADAHRRLFERYVSRTEPERAATTILRGVAAGRPRVLVGVDARIADLLVRVTGTGYERVLHATSRHTRPKSPDAE
jgi:NAD(P)-dependent dehydrogenase (short-subunit alcohol dehydrogenase family)